MGAVDQVQVERAAEVHPIEEALLVAAPMALQMQLRPSIPSIVDSSLLEEEHTVPFTAVFTSKQAQQSHSKSSTSILLMTTSVISNEK